MMDIKCFNVEGSRWKVINNIEFLKTHSYALKSQLPYQSLQTLVRSRALSSPSVVCFTATVEFSHRYWISNYHFIIV